MGLPSAAFLGSYATYLRNHGVSDTRPAPSAPAYTPKRRAKCESCGSREFKEHDGQMVCSYCRGVA